MIKIPIKKEDIKKAKKLAKEFDKQKTYEKIKSKNNYIGFLGEMLFNRFLKKNKINHKWIKVVKKDYSQADFVINNKKIDIKTSFDTKLWVQNGKFDLYVFARLNRKRMNNLILVGGITGSKINKHIKEGKAEKVKRKNRVDFVFPVSKIKDIEKIIYKWKNKK